MRRISIERRPTLESTAREHGYAYDAATGVPYWNETAYYQFSLIQIERALEEPTARMLELCYELLERAVADEEVFRRLCIPESYWSFVADSWRNREFDLYGRLDYSYDGSGDAKLLEFNADTPTMLHEAAIFQWVWFEEVAAANMIPSPSDQYADIHEALVAAFSALKIEGQLHFAALPEIEDDRETALYLEECAQEAGIETKVVPIAEIGIDPENQFVDQNDHQVTNLFKLYPWEWMFEEEFGQHLLSSNVRFFEPPWKAVLSNKGMLALLWEMFPNHPNLLPTYFEAEADAAFLPNRYVKKPLFSRQGANVEIIADGKVITRNDGGYGEEGHILQAYHPLPEFDSYYPVTGCWVVAGRPVGLSIREDRSPITGSNSNFVPHIIRN